MKKPIQPSATAGILIPTNVAVCPICDAQLIIDEIDEWFAESGEATGCGIKFNCTKEPPEIGSKSWWHWHNWHWQHPYVDWMPLEKPVLTWFNANYRIDSE